MRFLILFLFLMSNSLAEEVPGINNIVINKDLKKYDKITFLNAEKTEFILDDYKGNLILINFWATWCAPCKKEMPSLDLLQVHK